jgi:hypothetical protein
MLGVRLGSKNAKPCDRATANAMSGRTERTDAALVLALVVERDDTTVC